MVGVTLPLLFRVSRDGTPAADLQPYLGSFGHLVILRQGDLAYVHVHPEPQLVGGAVKMWLSAPSPGTYRMFFDFKAAGTVQTEEVPDPYYNNKFDIVYDLVKAGGAALLEHIKQKHRL